MSYGKQLKEKLKQKQITQQELSNLTGIHKSSISQYMSGHAEPSSLNREKIKEVVGDFTEETAIEYTKNVSPEAASKLMGVSPQFIRIGLQHGVFDFGYAVKMSTQYRYHISPQKFREYVGDEAFKEIINQ